MQTVRAPSFKSRLFIKVRNSDTPSPTLPTNLKNCILPGQEVGSESFGTLAL
jgi:hypothetical protein